MYGPSKYGLRALGTELRHEIIAAKLNIKITVRVHYLHTCTILHMLLFARYVKIEELNPAKV
jgi:hypothetical protein